MDLIPVLSKLAIALGILVAIVMVGTPYVQRALLYFPDDQRVFPSQAGLPEVEERSFDTPDGARVLSWWGNAQLGHPTILYFHGNGGSFANRSERMRKYLSRGFGVVMMTYRGYGGSTGQPSELSNVADAKQLYQLLIASGVAPDAIVLYGESLGSGIATQLAAESPVAGLILDAPYTSIIDMAERVYPYLPSRWLMTDRYETLLFIGRVTAPVLVVHGEADALIPVDMGRQVAASAVNARTEIVTFKDAGHSDHHLYGSYDVIYSWLERLRAGQLHRNAG
jgi:uncharacterized protein